MEFYLPPPFAYFYGSSIQSINEWYNENCVNSHIDCSIGYYKY